MTTVVILLLGLSAVLFISSLESNPDGSNVSVLQTLQDIWADKSIDFSQSPAASGGGGSVGGFGTGTGTGTGAHPLALPVMNNPAGGPSGNQRFLGA